MATTGLGSFSKREFPEGGKRLVAGVEREEAGPLQVVQGEEVLVAVALHHQPPVQLQQLGLEARAHQALQAHQPQQLVQRHLLAGQIFNGFC